MSADDNSSVSSMTERVRKRRSILILFLAVSCAANGGRMTQGQSTRLVAAAEVAEGRIPVDEYGHPVKDRRHARRVPGRYVAQTGFPAGPPVTGLWYGRLGVTVWRARPVATADGEHAVRELLDDRLVTFARIKDEDVLGGAVRVGIEALSGGYVYVVVRELYDDGTLGSPSLIYPNTSTGGRDEFMQAGRIVVVPGFDQSENLNVDPEEVVLAMRHKGRSGLPKAKVFTILLSDRRLDRTHVTGEGGYLTEERRDLSGKMQPKGVYRADLQRGIGRALTWKEKAAAEPAGRGEEYSPLNQGDPLPQMYFKGAVEADTPLAVHIKLKTVIGGASIQHGDRDVPSVSGDSSDRRKKDAPSPTADESGGATVDFVDDETAADWINLGELDRKVISKPAPEYPAVAKAARANGQVIVKVSVDETGRVIDATALSGHPFLKEAARRAALRARLAPHVMSGAAVKFSGTIRYDFQPR